MSDRAPYRTPSLRYVRRERLGLSVGAASLWRAPMRVRYRTFVGGGEQFFLPAQVPQYIGFLTRLSSQTQQARTHNPRIIVNQSLPRHLQAITTDDLSGRWWQREARAPALQGWVRLMASATSRSTQNRLLAALLPAEVKRYF